MRMHSIATILICAMVASSCATQNRQMTRQEFLSVSTKTYPHHDAEQVLAAAETILRLADSDYQFMHSQNGMKASRFWQRYMFLYLAQGNDYWTIEALPSDAGVRVSAQINTGFSGTNILPTTGGDLSASAGSSIAVSAIGSATYLLFFDRLDYLLWQRDEWPDCKASQLRRKSGGATGTDAPLCDAFNTEDKPPPPRDVALKPARPLEAAR
jgi:hypothetical protein